MEENRDRIHLLSEKVELLSRQQQSLSEELRQVQQELTALRKEQLRNELVSSPENKDLPGESIQHFPVEPKTEPSLPASSTAHESTQSSSALEEFIGTNLLNKIGIAILVIGIGFGIKYAIDHQMMNALTRTLLGCASGIILILVGLRLRTRYLQFSAVMLSGGLAVLYFVTYAASDFYSLIPRPVAFAGMIFLTVCTVLAAMWYNLQVIAVIGLVGAYAVPFLLSDGSGQVVILYTYMSIINAGILVLAFTRTWTSLYPIALLVTWLIFASWFVFSFEVDEHLWVSLIFSTVFFLIFHLSFLVYKLRQQEAFSHWDILLTVLNSFIFFGIGYNTISEHPEGEHYLGAFTLFTSLLHFVSSVVIFRQLKGSRSTFYFAVGLALAFLTLAVPIQLDGNWVTMIWAAKGGLLFWIGRTKQFPVYEKLSYPLILLSCLSLMQDWNDVYPHNHDLPSPESFVPFLINIQFFTTLWVGAILIAILRLKDRFSVPQELQVWWQKAADILVPFLLFIVLYFGLYYEINTFWIQRFASSAITNPDNPNAPYFNYDLENFKTVWLLIYSAVCALILGVINIRYVNSPYLLRAGLVFNVVVLVAFLLSGLIALRDLRQSYLAQELTEYYHRGIFHILIRYISLIVIIPVLWLNYRYTKTSSAESSKTLGQVFIHFVILMLLSSELIHWLDLSEITGSDKLALTVLWGGYALFLIIQGMTRDTKFMRMTGIILFGITLIKLFFYDMAGMSTIAKTLVMIILGALLLIASYLYNQKRNAGKG